MGELEKIVRKRTRWGYVEKSIIAGVSIAGLLSVAVVAPNALKLLKFFKNKGKNSFGSRSFNRALVRLVDKGMVEFVDTSRGRSVRTTERGERLVGTILGDKYKQKKKKRWDKKWRIVIFDVPERRKSTREKLRRSLIALGFARVQDSVWAYPYDCEDLIKLIKIDFRIGYDVLYVIAEAIEGDKLLKKHFKV